MSSTHESRAQRPERKSEVELKNTIIHEKKTHFHASLEAVRREGYERLLKPADNFWTGAQSHLSALREP